MAVRIGPNVEILRDGAVGGGASTNMWWLAVAAAVILFGTNPDSDAFVEYAQGRVKDHFLQTLTAAQRESGQDEQTARLSQGQVKELLEHPLVQAFGGAFEQILNHGIQLSVRPKRQNFLLASTFAIAGADQTCTYVGVLSTIHQTGGSKDGCLLPSSPPVKHEETITGGFSGRQSPDGGNDDAQVALMAAKEAVRGINFKTGCEYELVQLVDYEQQVVAGTNWRVTLRLSGGAHLEKGAQIDASATVWQRLPGEGGGFEMQALHTELASCPAKKPRGKGPPQPDEALYTDEP